MRSKKPPRRTPIVAGLAAAVFCIAFIFYLSAKSPTVGWPALIIENAVLLPSPALASQKPTAVGLPIRLLIPSIKVDSVVEQVGLTPHGAMDVPEGPAEVGWFSPGPRPGQEGSAVITGHYDWKDDIPAVFDDLHKLRSGDKIYITDEKGQTSVFVVRETKVYDKDADASDVFISSDGKARLNLITCTGDWNEAEKTFSDRLIVFADKE